MAQRTILVSGATGKQGGALIERLVADKAPFQILALTRDTESSSAKRLVAKSDNITLLKGNLDDCDSIFATLPATHPKVWGVFSIQTPISKQKNPTLVEEQQGKALVDAAIKHGVQMFVYSSVDRGGDVASETDSTNVPHFISKFNIEKHLQAKAKSGGMTYTILRPVAFFDNITNDFGGKGFGAMWRTSVGQDRPLQFIAVRDIGIVAAMAFENPDKFGGRAVGLAGDELTFDQAKDVFKKNAGGDEFPDTFSIVAYGLKYMLGDLNTMLKWFDTTGYGVKIAEVRKIHPGLQDFGAWIREESAWKGRA